MTKIVKVPQWVKNNAMWWAQGLISDQEYYDALGWLIKKKIIKTEKENSS